MENVVSVGGVGVFCVRAVKGACLHTLINNREEGEGFHLHGVGDGGGS